MQWDEAQHHYNDGYTKGCVDGYNAAIKKAIAFFNSKECCGYIEDIEAEIFIVQFKLFMKK